MEFSISCLHHNNYFIQVVRFHPNGRYIATGSSDQTCRLWDIQNGQCVRLMPGSKVRREKNVFLTSLLTSCNNNRVLSHVWPFPLMESCLSVEVCKLWCLSWSCDFIFWSCDLQVRTEWSMYGTLAQVQSCESVYPQGICQVSRSLRSPSVQTGLCWLPVAMATR